MVALSTQKMRVNKPRLRKKSGGRGAEVPIPVYEAMQRDEGLRQRLAAVMLHGVSTRSYVDVIPQMAESCGISPASISREFIVASEEALKELCERRFDEVDLLIIYIERMYSSAYSTVDIT